MKKSDLEKNQRRQLLKVHGVLWYVKAFLYAFGLLTSLYTLKQYNFTIINFLTPLIIWLAGGLIISLILERNYKLYVWSIIFFGSFCMWIFFLTNTIFSNSQLIKQKELIIDKHFRTVGGRYSSWVIINYNGVAKNVYVDPENESDLKSSSYIILTLKKGAWGYWIIENRELVKQ
jgi:hypothetical protein